MDAIVLLLAGHNDIEDARKVAEGIEEHRAGDQKVIPDLHKADPASVAFSGEAKMLKDYIFPRALELIGRADLQALGERMAARRSELMEAMA